MPELDYYGELINSENNILKKPPANQALKIKSFYTGALEDNNINI